MAHSVKCKYCQKTFDRDKIAFVQVSSKRYAHADCYLREKVKDANIPELEIIERHQHSGNVPYIKNGQDAAVAYGSYDFKFKNNTGNVIKIVMENTADNITAKIIKIQ